MTREDFSNWLVAFFKNKKQFYVLQDGNNVHIEHRDNGEFFFYFDMKLSAYDDEAPYFEGELDITNILLLEAVCDMWKKVRPDEP